jgi:hypothetical protein
MNDLLALIVQLCLVSGQDPSRVHEVQLFCQKYYIKCVETKKIKQCILDKEGKT